MSEWESAGNGTPVGTVFNVQRFSLHDGPGIRTTVFLKGCPLRCLWCHNPESQSRTPELAVLSNRCIRCGACVEACPNGAVEVQANGAVTDWDLCRRCGECVDACPVAGRTLLGREMTVADVLREAQRDKDFFEESGGGVTFSGGEPLAQPAFLAACLDACQGRGLHTCVDTCGYAPAETLRVIAACTDLFLYDVKLVDSAEHERHTGVPNGLILDNLRWLCANCSNVWVRMPLISGVNDGPGNVEAMVRLVDSLPGRPPVHVLPYHAAGSHKYIRSGRVDPMDGRGAPQDERLHEVMEYLVCHGVAASVGG